MLFKFGGPLGEPTEPLVNQRPEILFKILVKTNEPLAFPYTAFVAVWRKIAYCLGFPRQLQVTASLIMSTTAGTDMDLCPFALIVLWPQAAVAPSQQPAARSTGRQEVALGQHPGRSKCGAPAASRGRRHRAGGARASGAPGVRHERLRPADTLTRTH